MISQKQLEANRANARKSTGPKSEAGKKRSSLNAVRHGLTGQVVILPEEDREAFDNFSKEILACFEPDNAVERQLAQSYASYQWRINRAAAIEDNMFALGIVEQVAGNLDIENSEVHTAISNAKTFRIDAQEFGRLNLYAQRLVNQADKVLKQLEHLQAERRLRQEKDLNDVQSIYKSYRRQNLPFDPKENGFDLTVPQIESFVHRRSLNLSDYLSEQIKKVRTKAA